jgi:hypothetical protein
MPSNISPDGQHILGVLLPEWEAMFRRKQRDYGGDANRLGVKGAFVDIHRKEGKLKRAIWDGQKLEGEQPREILMDLIGHCFLTITALDQEDGQQTVVTDGELLTAQDLAHALNDGPLDGRL